MEQSLHRHFVCGLGHNARRLYVRREEGVEPYRANITLKDQNLRSVVYHQFRRLRRLIESLLSRGIARTGGCSAAHRCDDPTFPSNWYYLFPDEYGSCQVDAI